MLLAQLFHVPRLLLYPGGIVTIPFVDFRFGALPLACGSGVVEALFWTWGQRLRHLSLPFGQLASESDAGVDVEIEEKSVISSHGLSKGIATEVIRAAMTPLTDRPRASAGQSPERVADHKAPSADPFPSFH